MTPILVMRSYTIDLISFMMISVKAPFIAKKQSDQQAYAHSQCEAGQMQNSVYFLPAEMANGETKVVSDH